MRGDYEKFQGTSVDEYFPVGKANILLDRTNLLEPGLDDGAVQQVAGVVGISAVMFSLPHAQRLRHKYLDHVKRLLS